MMNDEIRAYFLEASDYIQARLPAFKFVWHLLAEEGACDAWGGAECKRVLNEWIADRCPENVDLFIRTAANRPPKQGS